MDIASITYGVGGIDPAKPDSNVIDRHAITLPVELGNAFDRAAKIAGAKTRARQIVALAQTPGARTATAWTQPQRVAILDAVGDLALMLSWLADDLFNAVEAPD